MKSISPCLWFDQQAEDAVHFYTTVFSNTRIEKTARYSKAGSAVSGQKEGSVMTIEFQLENLSVLGLNGGPLFKFTPALSFFVRCESEEEINEKWAKLSHEGTVRMGLDKYPWAEEYGWAADRFGVEWQLILAPSEEKIVPAFLFVDELFGKGEEALNFYLSVFPRSRIDFITRDPSSKSVAHCAFKLGDQSFVLMEGQGKHGYTFSPATSLTIYCENQAEVDHFWDQLSSGGTTERCGWLRDKYGVSWQVVPTILAELMSDSSRAGKVMEAMLKMTKLDIETLKAASR